MINFIPASAFETMSPLMLVIILAASIYFLLKGADSLINGAITVAKDFNIPKLIIGATILSLGTTFPEFAVSVMAAWQHGRENQDLLLEML
jgi:cation:H+ antiporter